MTALVLADHGPAGLGEATLHAVTAALQLGGPVDVLVAGDAVGEAAKAAASVPGVRRVLSAEAPHLEAQLAEDVAALLVVLAEGYDHLASPSTSHGKDVLPRAAALLGVAMVSDVVGIDAPDTFQRYVYAGNALATVRSLDALRVLTVRGTAFAAAAQTGGSAETVTVTPPPPVGTAALVSREVTRSERPDLASARVVVSGGRGLGSAENFAIVEELADVLGGAVGASRAAVDAGYRPNEYQVGQTGKVVAPELYVAVGISGAIQHLAGMKDSKVIVAINKDEEAPIFQVADYGLVGDLFQLVPELTLALKSAKA